MVSAAAASVDMTTHVIGEGALMVIGDITSFPMTVGPVVAIGSRWQALYPRRVTFAVNVGAVVRLRLGAPARAATGGESTATNTDIVVGCAPGGNEMIS